MQYFKVKVELGHLGCGNSAETWVYVYAKSAYEAMEYARKLPGVKHNKIPLKVEKITKEEYIEGRRKDSYIDTMDNIFNK